MAGNTCLTQYANLSWEGTGQMGFLVPSTGLLQGGGNPGGLGTARGLYHVCHMPLGMRPGHFGEDWGDALRRKTMHVVGGGPAVAQESSEQLVVEAPRHPQINEDVHEGFRDRQGSLATPLGNSKEPPSP